MNIIVKQFKQPFEFESAWEVAIVDGEIYFLAKDVLHYFRYARSSQGTIHSAVKERHIKMLRGGQVADFKSIQNRAMVITLKGLKDFTKSRGDRERQIIGYKLIDWIEDEVIPEMDRLWEQANEPKEKVVETLFDFQQEQDMEQLKKVMHIQSERMDNMDKRIKVQDKKIEELEKVIRMGTVHTGDGRKMIDADVLIEFLENQFKGGARINGRI